MTSRRDWQLQQLGITQWSLAADRGRCRAKSLSRFLNIFVW
ncbi:DNA polymerase III psi subunit [Klebsiella pneumoniae]|uniref:DNA polymerase III psi subunit n=1 Tax=Klebsiella pneumoniae TaxID=573 RepID=A0A4P0XQF9_KLEPN|nr:DNA polymerase III psi subunit [Klebsiella pneumoniae]